jgi:hypothetical protein
MNEENTETKPNTEATPDRVQRLVRYLVKYQKWRRGGDDEQPHPKELGIILDDVIKTIVELDEKNTECRNVLHHCRMYIVEGKGYRLTKKEEVEDLKSVIDAIIKPNV